MKAIFAVEDLNNLDIIKDNILFINPEKALHSIGYFKDLNMSLDYVFDKIASFSALELSLLGIEKREACIIPRFIKH